jgi:hypothetical protein
LRYRHRAPLKKSGRNRALLAIPSAVYAHMTVQSRSSDQVLHACPPGGHVPYPVHPTGDFQLPRRSGAVSGLDSNPSSVSSNLTGGTDDVNRIRRSRRAPTVRRVIWSVISSAAPNLVSPVQAAGVARHRRGRRWTSPSNPSHCGPPSIKALCPERPAAVPRHRRSAPGSRQEFFRSRATLAARVDPAVAVSGGRPAERRTLSLGRPARCSRCRGRQSRRKSRTCWTNSCGYWKSAPCPASG